MTQQSTCSCGANEPKRIIFPCAGQANVGQLTNLAALQLLKEYMGSEIGVDDGERQDEPAHHRGPAPSSCTCAQFPQFGFCRYG